MVSPEMIHGSRELTVEDIYVDTLCDEELRIASELHEYIHDWVLAQGNLKTHTKAIFLHMYARERIHEALSVLMNEFSDADSTIPPTEPQLWFKWAEYWQRGFRPDQP